MKASEITHGMRIAWGGAEWHVIETRHSRALVTLIIGDIPFHEAGSIQVSPDADIAVLPEIHG